LEDDNIYVISPVAAEAIRQLIPEISNKFYTLSDFVRDNEGRVIGARALSRIT
jgi:hypothetical protein